MEAAMLFLISMVGLIVVAAASLTWGVDTRDPYPDDHAR
jgi:hypothetical protein